MTDAKWPDKALPALTSKNYEDLRSNWNEISSDINTTADTVMRASGVVKSVNSKIRYFGIYIMEVASATETITIVGNVVRSGVVTSSFLITSPTILDNTVLNVLGEIDLTSYVKNNILIKNGDLLMYSMTYAAGGAPTPMISLYSRLQFT